MRKFICTFKNLFSLNFIEHSERSNCESDFETLLNTLQSVIVAPSAEPPPEIYLPKETDYREKDLPYENALHYDSGYLMKKCLDQHTCKNCQNYSTSFKELTSSTIMCYLKAFETRNKDLFGNLRTRMPGLDFAQFVKEMDYCFVKNFEILAMENNVGLCFTQLFEKITFSMPCENFPKMFLMKLFCKVKLFYSLKKINADFKSAPTKSKKLITVCSL
jgi:hypothetical protein